MTLDQHARVLERIAAHDPEGARQAMSEHLDGVAQVWREQRHAASLQGASPA
jgi:DNA-binding FadR family transcriptional regulator